MMYLTGSFSLQQGLSDNKRRQPREWKGNGYKLIDAAAN
jgi:hypothetical protein